MKIKPIGVIHSPFKTKKQSPILACKSLAVGRVEVYRKYRDGLKDIEGFSHLILIYKFHKSRGYKLRVKPLLDDTLRGLFSTRYPRRPNQIGITVVRLLNIRRNVLTVGGIDIIDNTPLLDIKPYVPEFAAGTRVRIGWLKGKL